MNIRENAVSLDNQVDQSVELARNSMYVMVLKPRFSIHLISELLCAFPLHRNTR